MRTIDFSQVLFNALQYSGNDRHNITSETFSQFRDFSSSRLREGWESFEWSDICRVAPFTSTTQEVNSSEIKFFVPNSEADEILAVFDKNPLSTSRAIQSQYSLYNDGSRKVVSNLQEGWYVYRIKCPELVGDLWSSSVSYSVGAQVYFDEGSGLPSYIPVSGKPHHGNFYNCIAPTSPGNSPLLNPEKWEKVKIPYVFGSFMSWGSTSNWLVSENMLQEAAIVESKAQTVLETEYDKATRQQGQFNRLSIINI